MFFLCIKIFFARLFDVSLGTVRTVFIVKGAKFVSSIIAFVEVMVWFYAAREALATNLDSLWIAISYAGGYASGTLVGTFINELFITGIYNVQVISPNVTTQDVLRIKSNGFGVSVIDTADNKKMLFLEINKNRYSECIKLLKKIDSNSFIVVNDSKVAYNGFFIKKKTNKRKKS